MIFGAGSFTLVLYTSPFGCYSTEFLNGIGVSIGLSVVMKRYLGGSFVGLALLGSCSCRSMKVLVVIYQMDYKKCMQYVEVGYYKDGLGYFSLFWDISILLSEYWGQFMGH